MDIYSFIKSKDIAEHCRTIEHEFTPLEMAVVIYHSNKTLEERHEAWQCIIDTQPDTEEIVTYTGLKYEETVYESLHHFLREYMRIENCLAVRMKTAEPGTVYTYSLRGFHRAYSEWKEDNHKSPYCTFDEVVKAMQKTAKTNTRTVVLISELLQYTNIGQAVKGAIFL